ncbi:MAG: hypothetical protein B7Z26_04030 [Asticcacaulis sp. 32-58-5]|nr:MAG: hypothetical protein B7Z26_04030 [Asticcacaulis sp. 32-58-5]
MVRRNLTLVSALCLLGLGACANTKGSWACKAEPGSSCSNIATIDANETAPLGRGKHKAKTIVDGSGPATWWSQEDARASQLVSGPRRESDQVMRVVIAAWVDAVGDYHAPSEVYGVMRKGGWWTSPPVSALTPALRTAAGARSAAPETIAQSGDAGAAPAAR